jgi:hypothetical protein
MMLNGQNSGNILFLILIAVALFAALSYAVTSSNRGSGAIDKEKAQLDQAMMDSYMAAINTGTLRLRMAGCSAIDYTEPVNQSPTGDKSCFLFHPQGGGVSYQNLGLDSCTLQGIELTDLTSPGDRCGNIVYAGNSGGRLYTTAADQGTFSWGSMDTEIGAFSFSNGLTNTNAIVASAGSYPAAAACRALGADWFLPAESELNVLYTNRTAIGGFNLSSWYWSSTETNTNNARSQNFSSGMQVNLYQKSTEMSIRCARR